METSLFDLIKQHGPVTYRELQQLVSDDEFLADDLDELIATGAIVEVDDQIAEPHHFKLMSATIVSIKPANGYVRIDGAEDDVYVDARDLHGALLNDRVFLEMKRGRYLVAAIIKHTQTTVIGEVYRLAGLTYLKVNAIAPASTLFVLTDYVGSDEELVIGEITKYGTNRHEVRFLKSLGAKNAPGNDITRIILEEGAPLDFPIEVEAQVSRLPVEVSDKDRAGRTDFRDQVIVTIDGESARDFDDAVGIKKTATGYQLGVHIADVSHYVKEQSPIDLEALNRGTSIYVLDRVVPMLPFVLSNGLCSLKEGVDRLTLSVIIDLDPRGRVVKSRIENGVINSKGRLTYTYVQSLLDGKKVEGEIDEMLLVLAEAAKKIRKLRIKRGALDLDLPELKINVDGDGKPISITEKAGNEAEAIIEDLMVMTNEVTAETVTNMKLPMLYRIHELPDSKRIDNLVYLLKRLGHHYALNAKGITPLDVQGLLTKFENEVDGRVIKESTLRSLAKARYAAENKGHFGLASTCYTHFTSPIRRYPDLIVHRLIKQFVVDNNRKFDSKLPRLLAALGEDTSTKERRAVTIERKVNDVKAAEYMESFIGTTFKGQIDGITKQGLFLTLTNGVSGLLKFELLADYFVLDDAHISAYGKRSKKRFMLGDQLSVIILSVNKEQGNIDLGLEKPLVIKTDPKKYKRSRGKKEQQKRRTRNRR